MAFDEGQGRSSQQSAENYWLQCIKVWYPELHSRTYFLPPLHFNRVPYIVQTIAGQQVLVPQIPQDGPCQTLPTAQCRSPAGHILTSSTAKSLKSGSQNIALRTIFRVFPKPDNLIVKPVYDSDVRDDRALQRVLCCLRELADNSQPKEVMMVISQLQFGKYLGHPSYAATAALLPRPTTLHQHFLEKHYDKGDFDVLIIHRQHGLITLEIKSVGDNFSQLKMTEQKEDEALMKKIKDAVNQLEKAEVVLKHLTSDIPCKRNVIKILVMPNISSDLLLKVMDRNPSDGKIFCQCLGVQNVGEAVKLCLLSDKLSFKRTPSNVNHIELKGLREWWKWVVRASESQPLTPTAYEQLLARFCGPATTVEVFCVTAPRIELRIPGEAVSATGEIMARLVLFPQQVELLNRSPPRVFLSGPPGTGKTIVLIMQGLTWLQQGHKVNVVSTCNESRAVTIAIEHQLMATTRSTAGVQRHQFYFRNREVEKAVTCLKCVSERRQLFVIADEVVSYDRKFFTEFCDRLIKQVPRVHLWGASMHHGIRPLCLEEVNLTVPLRSPPVVVREVMKADEININKHVHNYTTSDIPVPTDGPAIMRITHSQSDHKETFIRNCLECGHQIARVLTELIVGQTGNINGPPPLQYRDVLVLCYAPPTDDRVDSNGQVTSMASGLVQGLRASHVPVRVVEKGDEAAIRDTALGVGNEVTVTSWEDVYGLERKVVIVENRGDLSQRLYSMSRSTSQLVLIN